MLTSKRGHQNLTMNFLKKLGSAPTTFYLLLLIFIFSCQLTLISAKIRHRDPCSMDSECETNYCSRSKRICECGSIKDYKSGVKTEQHYDPDLGMCLSRIGQICTIENEAVDDELPPFRCVPDAICASMSRGYGKPSSQIFGSCGCKIGYQPTENGRRCISNLELKTNNRSPSAMDQLRPAGWNTSGGGDAINVRISWMGYLPSFVVIIMCSMLPFR